MEKDRLDELCGLVLGKEEKKELYEICIEHNIPISYSDLFKDEEDHNLWGISRRRIGLVETIIIIILVKMMVQYLIH